MSNTAQPQPDDVGSPRRRRKATQRERLIAAALEVMSVDGYPGSTVAKVIAAAGVSRSTFYEYFTGRDACLLAAVDTVNQRLLSQAAKAAEHADPSRAAVSAVDAIIDFCV
jgi:AcrR family transcriptional regulator